MHGTLPRCASRGEHRRGVARPERRTRLRLRSRIPLRRRRLRSAARLRSKAVPVCRAHAPAARLGGTHRADLPAVGRPDAGARWRDGGRRGVGRRCLRAHPAHPRRGRDRLRPASLPVTYPRGDRQAARRPTRRGACRWRCAVAGGGGPQPSGQRRPGDQVEQPAQQRAGDAAGLPRRDLRGVDEEPPRRALRMRAVEHLLRARRRAC